jgi:16S rRNA (guanine527-N7)-methyltransferase
MDVIDQVAIFREALEAHSESFGVRLSDRSIVLLSKYFRLLMKWNPRLHLVAPCSPEEFALRHVLESLLLVRYLPPGAAVADVGAGAGLPSVPCLIARSDIEATLIESSQKKAVFLREALKATESWPRAKVVAERFEDLEPPAVKFVTCRALDRFQELLPQLIRWSPHPSTLLLFGGESLQSKLDAQGVVYSPLRMPRSENRYLFVVNLE